MIRYSVILFLFVLSCTSPEERLGHVLDRPIVTFVEHDAQFDAGDEIELLAKLDRASLDSFLVLMTYSLGEHMIKVAPFAKKLKISIPNQVAQLRGAVHVSVYLSGGIVASTNFTIKPLEPFEYIQSYSGPATIESSGIDWHLITAIPKDKYNNPVADGTVVNFASTYPDKQQQNISTNVELLVAGIRIDPIRKAGKIYTGISSGNAHAEEREVLVTATWPTSFTLMVEEFYPVAEQRQVVRLNTSIIKDRFGNTVADGTLVNYIRTDNLGDINTFSSFTVSGRAEVQIENPSIGSEWTIYAYIDQSARSAPVKLSFKESSKTIPIQFDTLTETIEFGPITGPLQQFVPNGTEILYSITGDEYGNEYIGEIIKGYHSWTVPRKSYPAGTYLVTATIGNTESSQELDIVYQEREINRTKTTLQQLGWPKGVYISVNQIVDSDGIEDLFDLIEGIHPLVRPVIVGADPEEYDLVIGPIKAGEVSEMMKQLRVLDLFPNRIQIK